MKALGYLLLLVGIFVSGAYAARPGVVDVPAGHKPTPTQRLVAWKDAAAVPFGIGLLLMIGGAVLARREGTKGAETAEGSGDGKLNTPAQMLERMEQALERLDVSAIDDTNRGPLADRMSGLLEDDVAEFLEARPRLIAQLGLAKFAQMMGDFATFERNLARAWSAATDSCYPEVAPSVERAQEAIARAREAFG